MLVTPLVGVWIEILRTLHFQLLIIVTPLVGVWIEILTVVILGCALWVTPLVGVWIEMIAKLLLNNLYGKVTPLVGVWIEIPKEIEKTYETEKSLPLWECGLKSQKHLLCYQQTGSLPLWECGLKYSKQLREQMRRQRHSPCGSVD
mgnify:CR=1 FL=1